jgi:hypothetical protein
MATKYHDYRAKGRVLAMFLMLSGVGYCFGPLSGLVASFFLGGTGVTNRPSVQQAFLTDLRALRAEPP